MSYGVVPSRHLVLALTIRALRTRLLSLRSVVPSRHLTHNFTLALHKRSFSTDVFLTFSAALGNMSKLYCTRLYEKWRRLGIIQVNLAALSPCTNVLQIHLPVSTNGAAHSRGMCRAAICCYCLTGLVFIGLRPFKLVEAEVFLVDQLVAYLRTAFVHADIA